MQPRIHHEERRTRREGQVIFDRLSNSVIGCAIEVHRELGPGLLESAYEQCLAAELSRSRIPFQIQVDLPVRYKGMRLDCGYRIDLLIDSQLIVELKCVEQLQKIHEAQILTYMRLARIRVGLFDQLQRTVAEERH
jgi:GxxExxY protein